MADIRIERKRRSGLPWMLGVVALLILAGVLIWMVGFGGAGADEPVRRIEEAVEGISP